jgi:hypothetical protein
VEEASARVHEMSPRRGASSPRQQGSAGGHSSGAGSAAGSPRQPQRRGGGASEEGGAAASRLSRPGRPLPPAYDDLVQVGVPPQRSWDACGYPAELYRSAARCAGTTSSNVASVCNVQ